MLSAPIFVYSSRSSKSHLTSIKLGAVDDNAYLTGVTNRGLETSIEDGVRYIKIKDYYLEESFDNDTKSAPYSTVGTLDSPALWGLGTSTVSNGVTTTVISSTGSSGFLTCAFFEDAKPNGVTETNLSNITSENAFTFKDDASLKSFNTEVNETTNVVTLGKTTTDVYENARGNSISGETNFSNTGSFYPFVTSNQTTSSPLYGSNTNLVPTSSFVKKVTFSSSSTASYTKGTNYRLALEFKLYYNNQLVKDFSGNLALSLVTNGNSLSSISAEIDNIQQLVSNYETLGLTNGLIANQIRFDQVKLVDQLMSGGSVVSSTLASDYYSKLQLDLTGNYLSLSNLNLTTQPFVESDVFRLRYGSTGIVVGEAFTGFGSVKFVNLISGSGIKVEAKFSNTEAGINNAQYVTLGTVVSASSADKTISMQLDNPAYQAANNANYIQLKVTGLPNASNLYPQSTFSRMLIVEQPDYSKKQVLFTDFPDSFKFENGSTFGGSSLVFGNFDIFTNQTEPIISAGNYLYGNTSYTYKNLIGLSYAREGRLQGEFENYQKLYYMAKGSLTDTNLSTIPTYIPSSGAVTDFNSTPEKTNHTRHIMLRYNVKVAQIVDDPHWDGCGSNYSTVLNNTYGFHTPANTKIVASWNQDVYVESANHLLPGTNPPRYLFEIPVQKTNVDKFKKFLAFRFTDFTEVVVYRDSAGKIYEYKSRKYSNNAPRTTVAATRGLWYGLGDKYAINPKISAEFECQVPQNPTRVTFPAFIFDRYEGLSNSGITRDFEARLSLRYYNSLGGEIANSKVVKIINAASANEEIIDTPSTVTGVKTIKAQVALMPKSVPVLSQGAENSDFSTTDNKFYDNQYQIPSLTYYNDVGLNFSAKPRIEYIDPAITVGKYRRYVKSTAESKHYDLWYESGVVNTENASYSPDPDDDPIIKTEVAYGGGTSRPDGTSLTVQWKGLPNGADPTVSTNWTTDVSGTYGSAYNNTTWKDTLDSIKNARYIKFKVVMIPTTNGVNAPIVDKLSVKFWPYSQPYFEDTLENVAKIVSLIVTKFETKNPENDVPNMGLSTTVTAGVGTTEIFSNLDEQQNISQTVTIGATNNDVVVKVEFDNENVRFKEAIIDLFTGP